MFKDHDLLLADDFLIGCGFGMDLEIAIKKIKRTLDISIIQIVVLEIHLQLLHGVYLYIMMYYLTASSQSKAYVKQCLTLLFV